MITGIKKKKGTGYWYRLYYGECPVCGSRNDVRERVYGPKPKRAKDRIVYIPDYQNYDWCDAV